LIDRWRRVRLGGILWSFDRDGGGIRCRLIKEEKGLDYVFRGIR